jgi:BolA family transcriptional regulator, general stress-responsive regulator
MTTPSPSPVPTAQSIKATLRERLAPTHLEVIDESAAHAGHAGSNGLGYGTHFRVRIGGPRLAGLGRVQAHRLVYDALQPYIDAGLHAVAIEIQR